MRGCVLVDNSVHQSPLQDGGILSFAVSFNPLFFLLFVLRSRERICAGHCRQGVHSPFVFTDHISQRL